MSNEPPDSLEEWIRERREKVPRPPASLTDEILRQIRPPISQGWPVLGQWMAKAAFLLVATGLVAVRIYTTALLVLTF